jgi:hypothetical protein
VTFLRHLCHRLNVPRGRMTCHDCWNFVMGGLDKTPTQVRLGLYEQRWRPRAEGVGGVVCLSCFDKRARALNIEYRDHLVLFGHDSWMGGFYEGGVPL